MGKFNLIIQKGKCMKPINGDLCVDGNGTAQFFLHQLTELIVS